MVAKNDTAGRATTYHTLPLSTRVLAVLLPLVIVADGLFVRLMAEGNPVWHALPELVLGTAVGYILYGIPHTIVLREADACVEFRSILRRRVVPVAEIRAIGPSRLWKGRLEVTHARGSEWLLAGFPGFEEVLAWIRRGNPAVSFGGVLDR